MTDVLYIENTQQLPPEDISTILSLIGPAEREKALRYRKWQDRQAYLLGKLLVAKFLLKYGYEQQLLLNLSYSLFNRPYISQLEADFNISHSGDFVICAFSASKVIGIDIEEIQAVDFADFDYVLNDADKKRIERGANKYVSFFKIWAAKEAILKAHGCGLVDDIFKLEVNDDSGFFDNTLFYLKELQIDSRYACWIASSAKVEPIRVEKVNIENCLVSFKLRN